MLLVAVGHHGGGDVGDEAAPEGGHQDAADAAFIVLAGGRLALGKPQRPEALDEILEFRPCPVPRPLGRWILAGAGGLQHALGFLARLVGMIGAGAADRAAGPLVAVLPVDHEDLGQRAVGVAAQAQHEAGQPVVADVLLALAGRQLGADDEVLVR